MSSRKLTTRHVTSKLLNDRDFPAVKEQHLSTPTSHHIMWNPHTIISKLPTQHFGRLTHWAIICKVLNENIC